MFDHISKEWKQPMNTYNELHTYLAGQAKNMHEVNVLVPKVFPKRVNGMFMDSINTLFKELGRFPQPPKEGKMCMPTELLTIQFVSALVRNTPGVWMASFQEFSDALFRLFQAVHPVATLTKFVKVLSKGYVPTRRPFFSTVLSRASNKTKLESHITSLMNMSMRIPMLLLQLTKDIHKLVGTLEHASVKSDKKMVDTLEDVSVKSNAIVKREVEAWLKQVNILYEAAKVWVESINNCECDEELELPVLAQACRARKSSLAAKCTYPCAPVVASDLDVVCPVVLQLEKKLAKRNRTISGGQQQLSSPTLARQKRTAHKKRESPRKRTAHKKLITVHKKRTAHKKLTAQEMRTAPLTKQSQKHRSDFRSRSRSHRSDFRPRSRSHRSEFQPRSQSHKSKFRPRSRSHRSNVRPRSQKHKSKFRPRSQSHRSDFRSR